MRRYPQAQVTVSKDDSLLTLFHILYGQSRGLFNPRIQQAERLLFQWLSGLYYSLQHSKTNIILPCERSYLKLGEDALGAIYV